MSGMRESSANELLDIMSKACKIGNLNEWPSSWAKLNFTLVLYCWLALIAINGKKQSVKVLFVA